MFLKLGQAVHKSLKEEDLTGLAIVVGREKASFGQSSNVHNADSMDLVRCQ
jgi:hypothetical protein